MPNSPINPPASPTTIPAATNAVHALVLAELPHGTRTAASDGRSIVAEHPSLGLLDIRLCTSIPENEYFVREAAWIDDLKRLRARARSFISLVYAYRGCFKAVPTFNSPTDSEHAKTEYYRLVEEIVKPEIIKMKNLMEFYTTAETGLVSVCKEVAASLASGKYPTETLLLHIATTIDSLMTLDALKNVKTALNNDYTLIFRRSRSISKTQGDDKENQMLYLFLANKDVFLIKLKTMMTQVPGMDDLLWELSNAMADRLDRGHWANPREKFALVKTTAYAMVILDPVLIPKTMNAKHWKTDKIGRVFRTHPVIPLYGDLAITVAQLLNYTVNQKWDQSSTTPSSSKLMNEPGSPIGGASAVDHGKELMPIAEVRSKSTDYLAKLALSLATVRKNKTEDIIDGQCSDVFNTLVEGVQLLNSLTTLVLEMNAYKYTHPTNHETNPDCPETALNYEMAIRYNYSQEERFSLAEVISMIKSIEEKVLRAEFELNAAICKHKSIFMNSMKQMSLTNMTSHVLKKKRPVMHSMLKSLAELVGPNMISNTSICFMATGIVEWILKVSAVKPTGFMKDKDLKDSHISEILSLQHELYWLQQVHNLPQTVRQIVDLSELWYKEFYLDLSKQIQFPIETSLPWILINTMLDSSAVDLTHSLFVPFSIYNDAAQRALYSLKMQFLYDEIEAEANLAFDLFIYKYSSKLFKAFKCHAASDLFATQFKVKLDNKSNSGLDPPFHQHATILSNYKTVNILRRCIPFTQILCQMMNATFRRSFEAIIARFESSEITGVMELDQLLSVLRHTHALLSDHIQGMDTFDDMLKSIDEVSVGGNGRIFAHIASELEREFCTQFSYNNITKRFVRSPIPRAESTGGRAAMRQHKHEYLFGSKVLYQAYSAQLAPYLLFVGKSHFDAIVKVLGCRVPLLFSELAVAFESILREKLTPYLWALAKGFPGTCKLPGLDYGVVGTFRYFKVILKNTIAANDLVVVFQALRELGNLFLCIQHLESSMFTNDAFNSYHLQMRYNVHTNLPALFNIPPAPTTDNFKNGCTALALVKVFLNQMKSVVLDLAPLWNEGLPPSTSYDTSRELYRLVSFLQFSYCAGLSANTRGYTCREVFGDGVHWALGLLLCWTRQIDVFMALDFTFHVCYAGKVHGVPNGPVPDLHGIEDDKQYTTSPFKSEHPKSPVTSTLLVDYLSLGEYYRSLIVLIHRYYQATVGEGDDTAGQHEFKVSNLDGNPLLSKQQTQLELSMNHEPTIGVDVITNRNSPGFVL